MESYYSKSKKKNGNGEAVGGVFFVWTVTFLEKNRDRVTVGDALNGLGKKWT